VSTDRTKQVSVLDAPGSGHARDVCPVNATESTSGQVSLRLQQVGPRRTVLSSIGVGFIDHDAGASLVVLGDSIVAGVLERVESIAVDGAHEPQWSASEANDLALERGSVVDIANLQMDQAMILVFHGARRQPFTEREDADVHVLAYQGDVWVDVGPVKFRRGGGVVGVRVPRSQRLKLQVGRACTLWALGMMRAAETQALQPLELLGAWREHPGGEKQSIASVSGLRFDADDAVTLAYRSGADAEGRKREYFMLVEGFRDDAMGARGVTDDGAVSVAKWPLEFSPPRPVPSSGGVSFGFSVDTASEVDITIYDVSGKRVATVTSGRREAGRHHVHWDSRDDAGRRLAAGVYFGRLTVGKRTREQRVVLR